MIRLMAKEFIHCSWHTPCFVVASKYCVCISVFQAKLKGYRHERLKRRCPENTAEEDLLLKKRMVDFMEKTQTNNTDCLNKITSNIAQLTSSISEGFSLLRQMIQQPAMPSPYFPNPQTTYAFAHRQTSSHVQSHIPPPPPTPTTSASVPFSYIQSLIADDIEPVWAEFSILATRKYVFCTTFLCQWGLSLYLILFLYFMTITLLEGHCRSQGGR